VVAEAVLKEWSGDGVYVRDNKNGEKGGGGRKSCGVRRLQRGGVTMRKPWAQSSRVELHLVGLEVREKRTRKAKDARNVGCVGGGGWVSRRCGVGGGSESGSNAVVATGGVGGRVWEVLGWYGGGGGVC